MSLFHRLLLGGLFAATFQPAVFAEDAPVTTTPADDAPTTLKPVVVTAAPEQNGLVTTLDTHAAAQPIPAQDGADILKTIPGFSVSRKGGAGGEILLRGQSGSRVDLLLDGETLLGGCPHRMDPPTSYVFPGAFDKVTVLKGPQTVIHGPGNSAGVVLFESEPVRLQSPGASATASATYGSHARNDQSLHVTAGTPDVYSKVGIDRTQSDDYEDGDGNQVHSQYDRSAVDAAIGWTPDEQTVLELSGALGRGEAAYAGKAMDASQLDRENLGLLFRKTELSDRVAKVEARLGYNHADHIMDDFSLRTPGMMAMGASRVDHLVYSGRGLVELTPAERIHLSVGVDFRDERHRNHTAGTWVTDGEIGDIGAFVELTRELSERDRIITGVRADDWRARDRRAQIRTGGMMGGMVPNPTAGQSRDATLPAGFVRYERDLESVPATTYLGLGYTERAPDYWELFPNQSATTASSFLTDTEKTLQLDAGVNYLRGPFNASLSVFANRVDDYILYQANFPKGMMSTATITRNVDARSWGGEAVLGYAFDDHWKLDASLAYVRGQNRTDDLPLAQLPPLEGRVGLTYATPVWSVGGLARLVAAQDRFAVDQGTSIGQDIGRTGGFAVFSLNAGWRVSEHATLTAGVDNLFDKTYAEHVSTGGVPVTGYPTTARVNEPGRVMWIRLDLSL